MASLAEAALTQVEATHRAVEDVLAEVRDAQPAPVVPLETRSENGLDSARLVAIEMAVAGGSREEVGRHIRAAYELADVEALLDDVFGAGVLSPAKPDFAIMRGSSWPLRETSDATPASRLGSR